MRSGSCSCSSRFHTTPPAPPRASDGASTKRPAVSPEPSRAWIMAGANSAMTESPAKVMRRGSAAVG